MKAREYRAALKTAQKELLLLEQQREGLERRLAQTRQTVQTLWQMVHSEPEKRIQAYVPDTLTDACRWVLAASTKPIHAPAIRDGVLAFGFNIGSSNPLASVHSVLKRLIQQGEVHQVVRRSPDGSGYLLWSRAFWWGEHTKLPEGWVLQDATATRKQLDKAFKSIDEDYKSRLKAAREELQKQSKGEDEEAE